VPMPPLAPPRSRKRRFLPLGIYNPNSLRVCRQEATASTFPVLRAFGGRCSALTLVVYLTLPYLTGEQFTQQCAVEPTTA